MSVLRETSRWCAHKTASWWNFSFQQHSRRILNTTSRQFKTGGLNNLLFRISKQPGKVYSRPWLFFPRSSWLTHPSLPCLPRGASCRGGFPHCLDNISDAFSASPALLLPCVFPGTHTDPTVLHLNFLEPLPALKGIPLVSSSLSWRASKRGDGLHRSVSPAQSHPSHLLPNAARELRQHVCTHTPSNLSAFFTSH